MHVADFHLHSKYSRACSKQLDFEHIEHWCQIKGIDIVATSDFTHPAWIKEIETKLVPAGNGLFTLNSPETSKKVLQTSEYKVKGARPVHFILGTEISCIYSQGGKVRRVHLLVLFSEISHVKKFIKALEDRDGKLKSDGRPILGMSALDILKIALEISEYALVIPAHAWTPWFSVFGSKSGFDSVEECFGDYAKYIYALETGLSSDPLMNWRLSKNDKYTLVSNSDAHSLDNLGREANVFDFAAPSYQAVFDALKTHDVDQFKFTIEFFPQEGKYHLDGHAPCEFCCEPEETKKLQGRCPKCRRLLTVGVHHRIADLADAPLGREPKNKIPYKNIIPLSEIIADVLGVSKKSKKVEQAYRQVINGVGNEFYALLDAPIEAIAKAASHPLIAEGIKRMRAGKVNIRPGYDGLYGIISLFDEKEKGKGAKQGSLL
jgi:DNA helicase II / ATP-dependent DNA helicase PcrA